MKKYAIYVRVSTQKQGRSGLSLEHQQEVCKKFINEKNGEFVASFMDIESGTHRDRKGLLDAISFCKANDCALVFAKLDRLARDVEFCFKVVNTGIEVHFCDLPQINTLLLGIFATVGQYERELVSSRTKAALSVKKSQGAKLGASNEVYRINYEKKTREQKKKEGMKRGQTKSSRFVEGKDVQSFLKVLKRIFPDSCKTADPAEWEWRNIGTRGDNCQRIIELMKDYRSMDDSSTLFERWKFSKWSEDEYQLKVCAIIYHIKRTFKTINNNKQKIMAYEQQ